MSTATSFGSAKFTYNPEMKSFKSFEKRTDLVQERRCKDLDAGVY